MAYQSLKKLYYEDEKKYLDTYELRFHNADTIHLDFFVSNHPAFFLQNGEVTTMMLQILRADKRIADVRAALPPIALRQYFRKCLIDEIVLSNNIEGVYSSRKEIGDALDELSNQSDKKGKKKRFDGIVNKYAMLSEADSVPLNSCQDIRNLYDELVLDEVLAEDKDHAPDGKIFRKDQAEINNSAGKAIHKGLYPEEKIIDAMEKALKFLNNESIDVLYRTCLFHYLLEYIHPFYDGNGRLGRFIVSYCLSREMEVLLSYRISETIKEHIHDYYDAFSVCNNPRNKGDLTPFLLMMLQMILQSEMDLESSLKKKEIELNRYSEMIPLLPNAGKKDMFDLYYLLIQASLFGELGISTKELRAHFDGAGYEKIRNLLKNVPDSLLIKHKNGKENVYELNRNYLDAMREKEVEKNFS